MDIKQQIGINVRILRGLKGWSQEDLAEQSGIHRTYISGVERGIRNPTITIVESIARALKVKPAALLEISK